MPYANARYPQSRTATALPDQECPTCGISGKFWGALDTMKQEQRDAVANAWSAGCATGSLGVAKSAELATVRIGYNDAISLYDLMRVVENRLPEFGYRAERFRTVLFDAIDRYERGGAE